MMEFIALLITAIMFIILDMFWFSYSLNPIYRPTFAAIQGAPLELRLAGGLVAWFLLAVGIRAFAIGRPGDSALNTFARGALLGAVIYGVYNGTNYATFKDYPVRTAVADTLWGTFAVGAVSVLSGAMLA